MIALLILILIIPFEWSGPDILTVEEPVVIVVHSSVDTGEFDKNTLKEIYTLRKTNWESRSDKVYITDYKGDSELRSAFYNYLGFRVNDIKRIWLKDQFTGRALPPKVVRNVEDMIEHLTESKGAIGYIPLSKVTQDLKILLVISDE
jgi:ABC-type phosphate transport system substrate-binding protein